MPKKAMEILALFFDRYTDAGERGIHIDLPPSGKEKSDILDSLEYLKKNGYISTVIQTLGFYEADITNKGIRFMETHL